MRKFSGIGMVRLYPDALDSTHTAALATWQVAVNGAGDYAAQVATAKVEFSRRNTASNLTFRHVKANLTRMCCGARRCAYCEDSMADEEIGRAHV